MAIMIWRSLVVQTGLQRAERDRIVDDEVRFKLDEILAAIRHRDSGAAPGLHAGVIPPSDQVNRLGTFWQALSDQPQLCHTTTGRQCRLRRRTRTRRCRRSDSSRASSTASRRWPGTHTRRRRCDRHWARSCAWQACMTAERIALAKPSLVCAPRGQWGRRWRPNRTAQGRSSCPPRRRAADQ